MIAPLKYVVALALMSTSVFAGQLSPTADLSAPPDVATPPADAEKTASGLISRRVVAGSRPDRPAPTDVITVHYTGWSADGTMLGSSHTSGGASMFPLAKAMPGWRECVPLMTVGETRRCWIPQSLAYRGRPGRPTGTVVFDIELLDTWPSPTIPPDNVSEPPADAERTASGLAYVVLRRGTGARRPAPWSSVTVHYTGWTTDGKMFDSSVMRGQPTTLGLNDVISGWTEGMQLMVEGERTRFWIPQDLAYRGQPGSPRGMLVFDVELIRIE